MIAPVEAALRRSLSALIGIALFASVVGAPTTAAIAAVDPALDAGGHAIVRVADGTESQVAALARAAGADDVQVLEALDLVTAHVTAGTARALRASPSVRSIQADAPIVVAGGGWRNLDGSGDWKSAGVKVTEAEDAWKRTTGRGVTVAVVDTGVAPHPALGSRLLLQVDFVGDGALLPDPAGHGTHIAGAIAASGIDGPKGMAPDASLVSLRVLDAMGIGTVGRALRAVDWILKNRKAYGIRVANLSFGAPQIRSYHEDHLAAAVEALWFAGVLVVAAAGNEGPGNVLSPGADPFIVTVGSLDDKGTEGYTDDVESDFSARGVTRDGIAKPDVLAPGRRFVSLRAADSYLDLTYPERRVTTTITVNPDGTTNVSQYYRMSGTSVATALVSGGAALYFAKNPTKTVTQAKASLTTTGGSVSGSAKRLAVRSAINQSGAPVNQGLQPSRKLGQLLGSDPAVQNISWENVTWENITWENITWDNLTWENITWENVTWENLTWELAVNP